MAIRYETQQMCSQYLDWCEANNQRPTGKGLTEYSFNANTTEQYLTLCHTHSWVVSAKGLAGFFKTLAIRKLWDTA